MRRAARVAGPSNEQTEEGVVRRYTSAARQMQFYASLSLVSSPPLPGRARDPRDFTRGSRGGDATVLSTDDASENREERAPRRGVSLITGEREPCALVG